MNATLARIAKARRASALTRRRKVRLPPQRQPNVERLAYSQALHAIVARSLVILKEELFHLLPLLAQEASVVHDAPGKTYADKVQAAIAAAAKRLFKEFPNERLRKTAKKMGQRCSAAQREELRKQVRAQFGNEIAIDVVSEKGIAERVEAWAAANVQLIKKVPTTFYDEVSQRTVDALRSGERAEDLEEEIMQRYGVSESRARLIARDQIGKLNGEMNKARQENLGVEKFIWRTSEDERVRPEHEDLDGETFSWNDPPSEGIPGEPINCRCIAEPVLDEIFANL